MNHPPRQPCFNMINQSIPKIELPKVTTNRHPQVQKERRLHYQCRLMQPRVINIYPKQYTLIWKSNFNQDIASKRTKNDFKALTFS